MWHVVRRLLLDDDGQDLVEYALLVGFVAVTSAAALGVLETALHNAYVTWDTSNQALWDMPDPGGG